MISSVYKAPPGEYVRPLGRYLLEVDENGSFDNHYIRGAFQHQGHLKRYKNAARILVELVPEPGNPHDPWALAFYLDGQRIGYVAASYANGLHEYVAGHNRQGRAVYAYGKVRVEPGETERRATVFLPWWQDQMAFQEASGVMAECDFLIDALPEHTRLRAMRTSQDLAPADVRYIWSMKSWAPDLVWSKRAQIPVALRRRLVELDRERAEQERLVAAREREMVRIAKAEALAAKRKEKEEAKKQMDDSICRLAEEGNSKAAIARMLACSESRVRAVLSKLPVVAVVDANVESRRSRLARGSPALQMQREGFTRKDIAKAIGCELETVKRLLKDAKFFEAPTTDPDRLARALSVGRVSEIIRLAEAAGKLGWTVKEVKNARSDATILTELKISHAGNV